jgi:MFS transporter, DHA2 family, multidrug resistance protein
MITITVMLASVLQALDNTIANVALPRMQGSLSATQEQMTWVLTSYIVAAAVMVPLSGWLADRFGRKRLFLFSIVGFTLASAFCGAAQSIEQIVLFRLLQGLAGAALMPMSQAVMFDIYPPKLFGRAMTIWSMGVVLGPTAGLVLGGWLTDNYSWRWVFYINVPFGILAVLGVLAYFPTTEHRRKYFDFFGFSTLAIAVGALQIFLDRGPIKGWFESGEIKLEACIAALAFYLFFTHTATFKRPFLRLSLFKDSNFSSGSVMMFVIAATLFANFVLISPLLQSLMNYSVLQAGMAMAPRGIGTLVAMMIAGRLVGKVDGRLIIGFGLGLTALSLWQMTHFSMLMGKNSVVVASVIQGMGSGIAFAPMAALAFGTLAPVLRNEGTALFNLIRNLGSSVGISTVQGLWVRNTQVMHSSLAGHVTSHAISGHAIGALTSAQAVAALNQQVTAQAAMVAYVDDFHLMLVLTLVATSALLFVRKPGSNKTDASEVVLE